MKQVQSALGRAGLLAGLLLTLLAGCGSNPPRPATGSTVRPAAAAAPAAPAAPQDPAIAEEARQQFELAFRQDIQEMTRLYALFWPLARAAAPLCAERGVPSIGPWPGTLLAVNEASRPALRKLLGMDERLTFVVVVDHTPAARAGLRAGDILLTMDGLPIAATREAGKLYNERLGAAADRGKPLQLTVERNRQQVTLSVPVERTCAIGIRAQASDTVSAFAVGRSVTVTRGMLRFADDRELALVIGHEIAHIALGHTLAAPAAAGAPAGGGTPAGGGAPAASPAPTPPQQATPEQRALSQQRELDADLAGLALAASAGFQVQDAAQFWRRMAAAYPATIQHSQMRTHPGSPERFIAMDRASRDLQAKVAARAPLTALSKDGRLLASVSPVTPAGPWPVNWVNESLRGGVAMAAPEQLPYVNDDGRQAYRSLLTRSAPRAFALSENGNWAAAWGVDDPPARALARCAEKGGRNCRLYMVDSRLVWDGGAGTRQ